MSQSEISYPWIQAFKWADVYSLDLIPYCERVLIVGSLRRKKALVHDIEIMVISNQVTSVDLFGNPIEHGTKLNIAFPDLVRAWNAKVIQSGQKSKRLQMAEGITLELHLSSPESWAVESVIRTGPAEFSHKVVFSRSYGGYLPDDCRILNGWKVYRNGKNIPMSSEKAFLEFLGLGWVEPQDRSERLVVSTETVKR